ncbi:hypothetical protein DPMN_041306 [Dreissena polymorpha]|uniref:Uncharacterized protein n=1 Tax=Dreissena polymorpha TaxID=45954 RepID=A0A9D4CZ39_DREPO|nr:hypothetical protein DPMN_041306 [Dreissena polymorpha]
MQAMAPVTECEDRIRHVEVYLENRNIMSPPSPNQVPDPPGFDDPFTGLDTSFPLIASRMPRTQGSPIVNANSNTLSNATTINVHPSNDIDGNDGNSRGNSTTQLPVDQGTDVKGQSIPVRVTTRSRDTSDGDSWCEDKFKLLTTEVEDQGPKVKAIRVFSIRRDPGRGLVKLTLVANDNASLVLTDNFWPRVRQMPTMEITRDTQRASCTDEWISESAAW